MLLLLLLLLLLPALPPPGGRFGFGVCGVARFEDDKSKGSKTVLRVHCDCWR